MQVRKPCSGCGRRASTARISASVFGPMSRAWRWKPLRAPFGVAPVRARHVIGQRAVPRTAVAPRMCRHPLAAVEHLDGARGGAGVDLFADQRMRHRVEEACDLDMIVDADAGEVPVGILVVLLWQGLHGRPLDRRRTAGGD